MNHYYLLIMMLRNNKIPQLFDFIVPHPIRGEQDFSPYYKDILSDHNIKHKDVLSLGLEEAKFTETIYHYVLVVKLLNNNNPITFDVHTDESLTTEQAIEQFGDKIFKGLKVEGAILHKLRPELMKRKL
jgi:hypothetical protein